MVSDNNIGQSTVANHLLKNENIQEDIITVLYNHKNVKHVHRIYNRETIKYMFELKTRKQR